jgi:uncharacterized protein YegJ (DUF2314 family)
VNSLPLRSDQFADPDGGQVKVMLTFAAHLKMAVLATLAAAALALFTPPWAAMTAQNPPDRSPVIDVSSANAEMAAAIGKARATLPAFWASYDAPKPSETGHSLKVRFATRKNNGEHIWMDEVKKLADGRYSGRFANEPRDLPGKHASDPAEFAQADISDWMFMRNGKIVGGETIRVLLKSMTKADADTLRARLETP